MRNKVRIGRLLAGDIIAEDTSSGESVSSQGPRTSIEHYNDDYKQSSSDTDELGEGIHLWSFMTKPKIERLVL